MSRRGLLLAGLVGAALNAMGQTDSLRIWPAPVDSSGVPPAPSRWQLHGYVKELATVRLAAGKAADWNNLVHNRLNLSWRPVAALTVVAEARTRLFTGSGIRTSPTYREQVTASLNYLTLDHTWFRAGAFLLHSVVDRAYLDCVRGNWQLTVGKQRVNWAKSYVWNPNDVFNAYSFFDFDYEERPGTDAALVRYTTGPLSSVEAVVNLARTADQATAAGLYRFHRAGYDGQVLLGKARTDLVAGGGWAGQVGSAGFKGEVTYFQPYRRDTTRAALLADASFDYAFVNTFNLRLEALYNSAPEAPRGLAYFARPVTARTLTFSHLAIYGALGYDFTALVRGSLGGIWNVDDRSYFVNPTLNLSLSDNWEALLGAQLFGGRTGNRYAGVGNYVFGRFKWSF